jgi:hypothetical protein
MALPNRMSLRPSLLWLTLNLALIIQCLSRNNILIFFNVTYPLRCLRVPQVEYHWTTPPNHNMHWHRDDSTKSHFDFTSVSSVLPSLLISTPFFLAFIYENGRMFLIFMQLYCCYYFHHSLKCLQMEGHAVSLARDIKYVHTKTHGASKIYLAWAE